MKIIALKTNVNKKRKYRLFY